MKQRISPSGILYNFSRNLLVVMAFWSSACNTIKSYYTLFNLHLWLLNSLTFILSPKMSLPLSQTTKHNSKGVQRLPRQQHPSIKPYPPAPSIARPISFSNAATQGPSPTLPGPTTATSRSELQAIIKAFQLADTSQALEVVSPHTVSIPAFTNDSSKRAAVHNDNNGSVENN
ncbi:hypothetical protein N431DRAFT_199195 [Stipitochalara longipes BDJ]|nr:hypothetical protein N431DRAFT_199195 [Stipitochalara longipes BDJ]